MRSARLPWLRIVGLLLLVVAELTVLMMRFSTESLEATGQRWWADELWRWKVVLPPLAIAISTAAVLLGGERLRAELRRVSAELAAPHRAWPYLIVHLATFAVFARLTAFMLEGGFATSHVKPLWAALWLATAAASFVLWAGALCDPRVIAGVAWRARALLPVIAVVGAMAWGAGLITEGWWDPLRDATMNAVAAMVAAIFPDAVFVPEQLLVGTERFWVRIASVCAGYEGIGLIWVFVSAFLVMCRDRLRFPQALLLIPIGTVAVWIANAVRLTALIAIGTLVSENVALGGFHAYSGSLLVSAVALGIAYAARRSPFFAHVDAATDETDAAGPNLTAAYLVPFLAIVVAQMIAGAMSAGGSFDPLYPLRVAAVGGALLWYRRAYRDLRWTWSWEAVAVGVAVFAIWMALEPRADPAKQAQFAAALAGLAPGVAALWLAIRVVGAVVTVPIAEELAFRGYLARRLVDLDFDRVPFRQITWLAVVGSSVAFGLMHGRWLAGTVAGVAYAAVLYRRGALADAIVAHAVTNALLAAYVLATGAWTLW